MDIITSSDIEKARQDLDKSEREAQAIANEAIPQRRYGIKGITKSVQDQYVQRNLQANEALTQIKAKRVEIDNIGSEVSNYESQKKKIDDFNRGRDIAQKQGYNIGLNREERKGFKAGKQELSDYKSRQVALGKQKEQIAKFEAAGLKPVYVNNKVAGFEDSKLGKSYAVENIPSVVRTPQDKTRFESVGVVFKETKSESFINPVVVTNSGLNNGTTQRTLLGNSTNNSNPINRNTSIIYNRPSISNRASVGMDRGSGRNLPNIQLGQNQTSKRDAYFQKVEKVQSDYRKQGGAKAFLFGGASNFGVTAIKAFSYPIKSTKSIVTGASNLGRKSLNDPFFVGKAVVKQTPIFVTQSIPKGYRAFISEPAYYSGRTIGTISTLAIPTATTKVTDLFRTIGLRQVEKEAIVAPEFFAGQNYPKIRPGETAGQLKSEFKPQAPFEDVVKLEGYKGRGTSIPQEEYSKLPFNTRFKPAGYTASPSPFKKQTAAGAGSSELPGVYQAPRLSAIFLRVAGERKTSLVGLNPFGTLRPTATRITPTDYRLPPGVSSGSQYNPANLGKVKEFFNTKAELGKAYVPFIKSEKEAVIPAGTLLQQTGKRFFFKFEGRRIPVLEFNTLKDGQRTLPGSKKIISSNELTSSYSARVRQPSLVNPLSSSSVVSSSRRSYNPFSSSQSYSSKALSSSYSVSFSSSSIPSSSKSSTSSSASLSSISRLPPTSSFSYSSVSKSPPPSSSSITYPPVRFPPRSPPIRRGNNSYGSKNKGQRFLPGFSTFFIKDNKKQYLPGLRTKGAALRAGSLFSTRTLRATFGVERTNKSILGKDISFAPSSTIFRDYRIKGGKKIPLIDTFIQRKGGREGGFGRLSSRSELREIQSFNRNKIKMRGLF